MMDVRDGEGRGGVVFILLLVVLLAVTVAAAVVGLWAVALVDAVVALIIAVGLRVAFPARRAVLTYREILERQGRAVEPIPQVVEEAVEEPAEQPVVEQPLAVPLAVAAA